jgi:hypothetical protein
MAENYANSVATTLNGAIDDSTTSVIVTSTTGFPSVNFVARIESELVLATGLGGSTYTVTRAVEGTAAASHASGVAFTHVLSAASLERLYQLSVNGTDLTARRRLDLIGRGFVADDNGSTTSRLYLSDPATMAYRYDEFLGGTSTSGSIGDLGWSASNGTASQVAGESGRPGLFRLSSSASINTIARLFLNVQAQYLPANTFDMVFVLRLNNNDTDTAISIGLTDTVGATGAPTNGIIFRKAYADTNWQTVTRAASVETGSNFSHQLVDATNGPISTNFARFRLRRIDGSTIGFSINGGTEKQHTANIPTAALYPWVVINNQTAVAKTFDIDYWDASVTGLTR